MRKIFCLMLCFALTGCASMHSPYQIRRLPQADVAAFKDFRKQNDVTVAIKVLDQKEAGAVFYVPLQELGIQPVLVAVRNDSSKTYHFEKETILPRPLKALEIYKQRKLTGSLTGEGLKLFMPRSWGTTQEEIGWNVMFILFSPLLIPSFMLSDLSEAQWNADFRRDLMKKEISDGPVLPGTSKQGLIYMSSKEVWGIIRVELSDPAGSEPLVFNFKNELPAYQVRITQETSR